MNCLETKIFSILGVLHFSEFNESIKVSYEAGCHNEIDNNSRNILFDKNELDKLISKNIFTSNKKIKLFELIELSRRIILKYKKSNLNFRFFAFHKLDSIIIETLKYNCSDIRNEGFFRVSIIKKGDFEYKDFDLYLDVNIIEIKIISFIEDVIAYNNLNYLLFERKETNLICMPSTGGHLIHEILGHFFEADIFQNSPYLKEKYFFNTKIASENLSVSDDLEIMNKNLLGLNIYDDEGYEINKICLVNRGSLKGLLSDSYHDEVSNNFGCARRQNYKKNIMPRMRATYIEPVENAIKYNIAEIQDEAIVLKNVKSGYANQYTGEFMVMGTGVYIKEGKNHSKLNNIIIKGDVLSTLNSINFIGSDFEAIRMSCGKKGQIVTVGVGSPTIKIDNVTVMGI